MFRQGNLARRAARSGAASILAVAGLLAGAAGVSAAPLSGPATPTAFAAPVCTCTITSGVRLVNRTTRIPIRLQEAGPDTVGSTDMVTLSSPGAALGGPFPAGTSSVGFSGALPVTGAQADAVPLAGAMTDTGRGVLRLSGRLMLNAAGLDHILPPTRFTVTIHAASVVSVVVTCVLVSTMTATMPASVAVQVVPGAATVPLMAGATLAGAPGTGDGSLHHAGDLAGLAVGGAAGRPVRGRRPAHRCRDGDPRRRGHVRPAPGDRPHGGSPGPVRAGADRDPGPARIRPGHAARRSGQRRHPGTTAGQP